jgi:protein SCO1
MNWVLAGAVAFALTLASCAHANRAPGFDLLDDRGQIWALGDQTGGTVLLFGYTHCDDTCPLMLAKLSTALKQAKLSAGPIGIAFVTVDPKRDSPRVLHEYLSKFGSEFVGLTGTPTQIESVERSYHVWAQKVPSKNGGYDYDEAHSSTMFFIDRHRNIVSLHDSSDSVGDLASAMRQL